MDTLTIRQAFDALVFFLEGEYQLAKSDYILDSNLMAADNHHDSGENDVDVSF